MVKRAVIIHGWSGYPEECWFPWMKKELEAKGFEVQVPQMPDADAPKIESWVSHLAKTVGNPDKETFLIGHSIGCQTILRYLQTIDQEIGGTVLVAGFFVSLTGLGEEEQPISKPWMETPLDFEKIKKAANKITCIFSDNDPYVPLDNVKAFEEKLGAKTTVLKQKGHMGASDNCPELPEALNAVLEIAK